ncbi:MAG: YceI family protein [Deinococcales bacterium]
MPHPAPMKTPTGRPTPRHAWRGRARLMLIALCLALLAPVWASAQTYTVVTDQSQAGNTVSEKVVGLSLPRDAVGVTKLVSGSVVLAADGSVSDGSKLTVDLRGLTSDAARRDRFIQRNTLQTDTYPDAVLVPTKLEGLPWPLPTSGSASFRIVGDFTVHGTTKSVTWDATADFSADTVTVKAKADVTFDDFGLKRPVVGPILAVSDPIHLEVDATLRRAAD